jgi:hypothetical protein
MVNLMSEVLTLEEMKHRYYGEWLIVACTELDDQMNPIRGEVVAHSHDRDTIYDAIANHRHQYVAQQNLPRTLAIEYVGNISTAIL